MKHLFCLDTPSPVRVGNAEYVLRGWFIPDEASEAPTLIVRSENTSLTLWTGLPRWDVAKIMKASGKAYSGFTVRFEARPGEPHELWFAVKSENGVEDLAQVAGTLPTRESTLLSKELSPDEEYRAGLWSDDAPREAEQPLPSEPNAAGKPSLSLILLVSDPHPYLVSRALISALAQTEQNIEVLVCNLASAGPQPFVGHDERIRLLPNSPVGSISSVANYAAAEARGEWVAIIDAADELHPSAAAALLQAAAAQDVDFVYCDEDRMDVYGQRHSPKRNPEPDIESLLCADCTGSFAVFRRSLLTEVGGFKEESGEKYMWDFALRVAETKGVARFRHVPEILYHRRSFDNTTRTITRMVKLDTGLAAKVVASHLARTGKVGTAVVDRITSHVRIMQPQRSKSAAAIFVRAVDGQFQQSIIKTFVDGRVVDYFEICGASVHRAGLQLAAANGAAANGRAHTVSYTSDRLVSALELCDDILIFFNRPLEILNHRFLPELIAQASRSDCGLATGLSVMTDGTILHSGFTAGADGTLVDKFAGSKLKNNKTRLDVMRCADSVAPYFFATRAECFVEAGGLPLLSEDRMTNVVERLAKQAKARGELVIVTPFAIATFV